MAQTQQPRTTLADNAQELELKLQLLGFSSIEVHEDMAVSAHLRFTLRDFVPVVFRELSGYHCQASRIESFKGSLSLQDRMMLDLGIDRVKELTCSGGSGDLTGCPVVESLSLYDCQVTSLKGLVMGSLNAVDISRGSLGSLRGLPLVFPGTVKFEVSASTKLGSCYGAPIHWAAHPTADAKAFKFPGKTDNMSSREAYNRAAALVFSMPEASLPIWATENTQPLIAAWAQMRLENYENCNEVFKNLGRVDK